MWNIIGGLFARSNFPFHLTTARLQVGIKPNGCGWAAASERRRWVLSLHRQGEIFLVDCRGSNGSALAR
jgi:hypothetical protein